MARRPPGPHSCRHRRLHPRAPRCGCRTRPVTCVAGARTPSCRVCSCPGSTTVEGVWGGGSAHGHIIAMSCACSCFAKGRVSMCLLLTKRSVMTMLPWKDDVLAWGDAVFFTWVTSSRLVVCLLRPPQPPPLPQVWRRVLRCVLEGAARAAFQPEHQPCPCVRCMRRGGGCRGGLLPLRRCAHPHAPQGIPVCGHWRRAQPGELCVRAIQQRVGGNPGSASTGIVQRGT